MNRQLIVKLLVTISLLAFQAIPSFSQDCQRLSDGKYEFKHIAKELRISDFTLIISGERYTVITKSRAKSKGKIEWWPDNCMFKLVEDNQVPITENQLNSNDTILAKTLLSFGGSCYEITGRKKFRLTYCGNLHITKSEGRITKR